MESMLGSQSVDRRLEGPGFIASVIRFTADSPTDRHFWRPDSYWLDLCLTPRPVGVRGCYAAHWGPHRFERLGDLFLIPPGEELHIRSDGPTDQSSIVCEIDAERIARWLGEPLEWSDRRLAVCLDMPDQYLRGAMGRLALEASKPGPGGEQLVANLFEVIAIDLARFCREVADGPVTGGLAGWRLRLIDERLQREGPPPTLGELAATCNVSIRQLTRGFRASRGVSIGEHIAHHRLELAKRLLAGERTIKEIAFATGFASPSAFTAAFRKDGGMTPSRFRQRMLRPR